MNANLLGNIFTNFPDMGFRKVTVQLEPANDQQIALLLTNMVGMKGMEYLSKVEITYNDDGVEVSFCPPAEVPQDLPQQEEGGIEVG